MSDILTNPPEEFSKIINDFVTDILITFPEYSGIVARWWNKDAENNDIQYVYNHCVKVFPERFFDILYKNVEIFHPDSDVSTEFLPGIVFKLLWNLDISDITRDTIWKYLQLILFSVIGSVHNTNNLGDTAKLFEAINEDELKKKLEETLEGMQNLFDEQGGPDASGNNSNGINMENLPNAEQLHEHINSMMGGKIGKLALELAEEAAVDLDIDLEDSANSKDVFQKLFKNPGKMMNMVKNIGNKIDEKIKSGEIKESELMEEGMELLNKMKNMPGMGDMQKMFAQMGLGKGKMNMGAMEAQLNRNMKAAKMKERFRSKVDAKREQQNTAFCNMSDTINTNATTDEELIKIFSTGEKVEKTPRGAKPPLPTNKKGKKKR